jgi:hypothetical protein
MRNTHIPQSAARARAPVALVIIAIILALLLAAAVLAWLAWQWHTLELSAPLIAAWLRYTIFILPIVLGAYAVSTGLAIVWRRWGDHRYIQAHHVTALTKAQRIYPEALHSLSYHDSHKTEAPAQLALPAPEAVQLAVPTFSTMLDNGLVGPGRKLVLGYDEGGVMEGDWTDLYSTAVAGMPGQGKTTSQRFFACQTALHGARFAVIDPHAGAGADSLAATLEPLGSTFLCPIASDDKAMLNTVRYIADIGAQRVKGIDKGETPIILWVDELTSLLGRSSIGPDLAELLERIAQEYRKKHVFVSASGQIWTASRTSSELRDSFASVICHRMKRGQARMLLPTDEAQLVERLSPGRAVLWRTSGATTVIGIPNTTEADVKRVATMIGTQTPVPTTPIAPTTRLPLGFHPSPKTAAPDGNGTATGRQPDGNTQLPSSASGSAIAPSAEALRAAALFMSGKSFAEIVQELRNISSKTGGRAYIAALREVEQLVRAGLARGA